MNCWMRASASGDRELGRVIENSLDEEIAVDAIRIL
jgi:hypothetical protein